MTRTIGAETLKPNQTRGIELANDQQPATPSIESQTSKVFAWRHGFNATFLIDLGIKLGIFRDLAVHPAATAEEIAARLALNPWNVTIWCNTAYSIELLDADADGRFSLAPFMDQILAQPRHPRYVGGYVQLGSDFVVEDFRFCRDAFRSGEVSPFQGRSEGFSARVAEATHGLQFLCARKLLPELEAVNQQLTAGGALLEVGCGAGTHLLMLHKQFPQAVCVGVDIDPTGIAVAAKAIADAGIGTQVKLVAGTIADTAAFGPYSVVVMVEVLHEIAQPLRQQVITACARVLQPGGWLVIVDETYPGTLAELRDEGFRFAVQTGFEELVWGNVIPTREEQETLLRTAGFSSTINRSMVASGFTVLTTQKP